MNHILKILGSFVKICLAGCVSLFFLSLFCLIYEYSGVHITNEEKYTDFKWEPNQWYVTMTEGFSWFHMDTNGFHNAAAIDREDVDVLLMGSSHIEAVQIATGDTSAALLNVSLTNMNVYNIGTSGHTLCHCINNLQYAAEKFSNAEYIIIGTDSVDLSEDEMNKVMLGEYERIYSYDNGIIYQLQRKVPAIKTLYRKIGTWKSCTAVNDDTVGENKSKLDIVSYEDTLDAFMEYASGIAVAEDKKLIIFYHPDVALNKEGVLEFKTREESLEKFHDACERNGIIFIDMSDAFGEMYLSENVLPYGFYNTAVGEGHLNKFGHRAVAGQLESVILEEEQQDVVE